jgi:hypothetical protein
MTGMPVLLPPFCKLVVRPYSRLGGAVKAEGGT